jgi:hypothetical protein
MKDYINLTLDTAKQYTQFKYKHVLEFGVQKGRSIKKLRNLFDNTYKVFGFDSFKGLPKDWVGTKAKKGACSTNGTIPSINGVIFYKGLFVDTILQYIEVAESISLLHIDCDLYSSTKNVLWGLKNYIKEGTVLVFDEWYYNHKDTEENRQHEQKAFYEWVKQFNVKYELIGKIEEERKIVIIKRDVI